MPMCDLMRCLPHRMHGLVGLVTMLVLLVTAASAGAMGDPAALRPLAIPGLPAGTTTADQPVDVLPASTLEAVRAGIIRAAVRDFTSGGVTVGREIIVTSDDPGYRTDALAGFTQELGTPAVATADHQIWRGQTSADGTMALNAVGVTGPDGTVYLALAATVRLSDEQLARIADLYRPVLGLPPAAAAHAAGGSSGSPIVNILVIALAAALVAGTVVAARRRAAVAPAAEPTA